MAKVDKIDQKILSELSKDSSISIPKLAEKINANSSVVYSRIKRLLKNKLKQKLKNFQKLHQKNNFVESC